MTYKKLAPHIKEAWTKALRSGQYKQGRLALRSFDDKYCCLGVLCDIGDRKAWKSRALQCLDYFYVAPNGRENTYNVREMLDVIGLDSEAHSVLTDMNDEGRKSFAEIADWIDKNL